MEGKEGYIYRGITGINGSNFLQSLKQLCNGGKTLTWTWLCPTCKKLLEEEIAKPVNYMRTPKLNVAATITLLRNKQEEECLTV